MHISSLPRMLGAVPISSLVWDRGTTHNTRNGTPLASIKFAGYCSFQDGWYISTNTTRLAGAGADISSS